MGPRYSSHMRVPFLVSLARLPETISVGPPLEYDVVQQVNVVHGDARKRPAVLRADVSVLMTKKADREKGEDAKDRWPQLTHK